MSFGKYTALGAIAQEGERGAGRSNRARRSDAPSSRYRTATDRTSRAESRVVLDPVGQRPVRVERDVEAAAGRFVLGQCGEQLGHLPAHAQVGPSSDSHSIPIRTRSSIIPQFPRIASRMPASTPTATTIRTEHDARERLRDDRQDPRAQCQPDPPRAVPRVEADRVASVVPGEQRATELPGRGGARVPNHRSGSNPTETPA